MKAKPIMTGALALRYPVNQFLIKSSIQWSQVNGILHGPVEISVKRPCKISKRLVLVQRAGCRQNLGLAHGLAHGLPYGPPYGPPYGLPQNIANFIAMICLQVGPVLPYENQHWH